MNGPTSIGVASASLVTAVGIGVGYALGGDDDDVTSNRWEIRWSRPTCSSATPN
ncbi:hypothetical protein [Nocardia arthritidis]|uniref:Uncharacterized protein n=1 Tax=Nocardia arthritidis TaxID=228602 RepID=A0A6G9YLU7_9NOCA|nr:hypothetical protein [Nocardia arthritidis]QIS14178.1 hypothetical protein F5544_31695 [Nocardia arthritidis]